MTHRGGKQEEKSHLNKSHLNEKRSQQLRQSSISSHFAALVF